MAGNPTREDTYAVHVWVDDIDLGIWDKMSGGEIDSDSQSYRPGDMGDPEDLGGTRTTSNVTVSRLAKIDRDLTEAAINRRISGAGQVSMKVSKQPLTIEGVRRGRPLVYTGKFKRVKFPDVDSESTSAALIELEMTVTGFPTA